MPNKDKLKRPIIIKKVKKGGHGHHGGSWKVAYADFVTAMMAFFLVMWIVGMEEDVKEAIEGYFSNPVGFKKGYGSGAMMISSGNSPNQKQKPPISLMLRQAEEAKFKEAEGKLREAVQRAQYKLENTIIEVSVTEEGLRIEIMESGDGNPFFPTGSAIMRPPLVLALQLVAGELVELSNPIAVEGHTDGRGFGDNLARTNWELSADRANAARRVLEVAGIPKKRISEVRGYADTRLRVPTDPFAAQNRRISLLLPFTKLPSAPDSTTPPPSPATAVDLSDPAEP